MFDVPILILAFNRADTTQKVFDNIKLLRPSQLFVAVDGPRGHVEGEQKKCQEVHDIFDNQIDWECKLHTLYREKNLGCRAAVNQGITWFFEHVEEGIILEDDCVPKPSFFQFAKLLLEKYRDDENIMHISGYKPHNMNVSLDASYFYSKQAIVGGWATWASSWSKMDVDMKDFPRYKRENLIKSYINGKGAQMYMLEKWEDTYLKKNSSWAYAWSFCVILSGAKTIIPNVNMIDNIGYGEGATNTTQDNLGRAGNVANDLEFPLKYPKPNNGFSDKENDFLEKEVFYKLQKSKTGLLIRQYVPRSILNLVKSVLNIDQ